MQLSPVDHPNTYVATVAGAIVSNIVWILGYYSINVPAGIAAGWVTITVAVLLLIGKKTWKQPPPTTYVTTSGIPPRFSGGSNVPVAPKPKPPRKPARAKAAAKP